VTAKREAATDLTTAAQNGALSIPNGEPLPLDRIAKAHDRVDAGAGVARITVGGDRVERFNRRLARIAL
jgi:NADPH2:quinone reductase